MSEHRVDLEEAKAALTWLGFVFHYNPGRGFLDWSYCGKSAVTSPAGDGIEKLEAAVRSAVLKKAPGSYACGWFYKEEPEQVVVYLRDRNGFDVQNRGPAYAATYAEAWIVAAIMLHEYERAVGVPYGEGGKTDGI